MNDCFYMSVLDSATDNMMQKFGEVSFVINRKGGGTGIAAFNTYYAGDGTKQVKLTLVDGGYFCKANGDPINTTISDSKERNIADNNRGYNEEDELVRIMFTSETAVLNISDKYNFGGFGLATRNQSATPIEYYLYDLQYMSEFNMIFGAKNIIHGKDIVAKRLLMSKLNTDGDLEGFTIGDDASQSQIAHALECNIEEENVSGTIEKICYNGKCKLSGDFTFNLSNVVLKPNSNSLAIYLISPNVSGDLGEVVEIKEDIILGDLSKNIFTTVTCNAPLVAPICKTNRELHITSSVFTLSMVKNVLNPASDFGTNCEMHFNTPLVTLEDALADNAFRELVDTLIGKNGRVYVNGNYIPLSA